MFRNYLKTALRNIWKNKTYSFLNLFGLAIGIACSGLVFLWVENELSYDSMYPGKGSIYMVLENWKYPDNTRTFSSTPGLMGPSMKADIPGIASTCRMDDGYSARLMSVGDKSVYSDGHYADSSVFRMFSLPFVQGNAQNAFTQLYSIVLTEKAAQKIFGDTKNVLGKTVRVDQRQDYVVTGILKDLPRNSTLQFEWLAPFDVYFKENAFLKQWDNNSPVTYAELKPGVRPDAVNKQLKDYVRQRVTSSIVESFLFPMQDWHLRNRFENGQSVGGRIEYVHLFSVVAWIILLIACINFMNLATARSEKRGREVGVRKVLGAEKSKLVIQFIGEAILMSFFAAVIALLLISMVLPVFNLLVEQNLIPDLQKPVHLEALAGIILISGIVAGSYPSLYLSSFKPAIVLKGLKVRSGGAGFIRKGLVVMQFTVSIVLIISTVIIYQQIQHIKSRNLGFDKDRLIEMQAPGGLAKRWAVVKQDLLNTGVIESAGLSDHTLIEGGNNTDDMNWEGKDPSHKVLISIREVSPEFIPTAGLQLMAGRQLQVTDSASEHDKTLHVIITESLAHLMGQGSAVGKALHYGSDSSLSAVVVGVVKDYVYGDMYGKPDPVIFLCHPQAGTMIYVRTRATANPEQVLSRLEAVMKKDNPAYPFDYRFIDQQFNNLFENERLISKLSRVFAALAIFISCLGLFGLAAFTAERRTKEIGIRKVLGAGVTDITRLLSIDFLKLILLSNLVAFPLAWWVMHSWLANYAYRVDINGWVFVIAGLAALVIALGTISFQAVRAGVMDPVKSIRNE